MSTSQATSQLVPKRQVTVWDPLVRVGHWVLVLAFALAYLSGEDEAGGPDRLHVWSGYVVGGIVVLRVLWGFFGPLRARFSDFACSPARALRYMADLPRGRARRYLGHSPAGGVMVLALLACLGATVATGLMAYGGEGKGPLAGIMAPAVSAVRAPENDDVEPGRGGRHEESILEELHDALANITLVLVVLHIVGVGLASVAHRENLVAAMLHGRKREAP